MRGRWNRIATDAGRRLPSVPSALVALILFLLLSSNAPAVALRLDPLFADGVVLQRDAKVPIWGTARPGVKVEVEFAGQKKAVIADVAGKWCVVLDAMAASVESRELVVRSDESVRV